MNRICLFAVLALAVSSSGCCLFRKQQQVATAACAPVQYAPAMQCAPVMSCDPCATQGVTYGMPATGYFPQ